MMLITLQRVEYNAFIPEGIFSSSDKAIEYLEKKYPYRSSLKYNSFINKVYIRDLEDLHSFYLFINELDQELI